MRYVLNINEKIAGTISGFCEEKNMKPEELFVDLFTNYIQAPVDKLDEIMAKDKMEEFEEFQNLLHSYLNEAIDNIEAGSKIDNSNEADKVMAEVFKVLSKDMVFNASTSTKLFEVYEENKN